MIKLVGIVGLILAMINSVTIDVGNEAVPTSKITLYRYYDIDLSYDLQNYVFELANKYNLSPELILAVAKLESNYNENLICVNKNGTKDIGIMQLNNKYMYDFAKDARISNFNPLNPYQNLKAGVFVLAREKDYWSSKGYSDEIVFELMLSSYNRGRYGTLKYGVAKEYVDRVLYYKEKLERNGGF